MQAGPSDFDEKLNEHRARRQSAQNSADRLELWKSDAGVGSFYEAKPLPPEHSSTYLQYLQRVPPDKHIWVAAHPLSAVPIVFDEDDILLPPDPQKPRTGLYSGLSTRQEYKLTKKWERDHYAYRQRKPGIIKATISSWDRRFERVGLTTLRWREELANKSMPIVSGASLPPSFFARTYGDRLLILKEFTQMLVERAARRDG